MFATCVSILSFIFLKAPTDFKNVVRRFAVLQAERVEAYKLFEETGPHYDFEHYKQLVHEITKAFCGFSKEVLEIKEQLHQDFDRPDLSEHIDKLQIKEKEKLELVGNVLFLKIWKKDHPLDIIKNTAALSEILQDFKYDSDEPE
uniref:Required for excision 1-B domain containing n=1 Tax=Sinocyclocheilus grahami TaxID=75366 RepID=A0A672P9J2_SINGR